ncbi:hypothetical protein EH240_03720 [Mesorhizobium tamadayense]|uniref:Uncharacterized protein n=1 Tax=Mesorhizobium tamadayense TaxID=425306 RepID=A0A3P3G687_9HYPH|nr:hypothetical protein EH240_03720 [Mesorhizobium tamadayense]
MTTDTPLTRYSATNGALASGFVTAELHHLMGHDPEISRTPLSATGREPISTWSIVSSWTGPRTVFRNEPGADPHRVGLNTWTVNPHR